MNKFSQESNKNRLFCLKRKDLREIVMKKKLSLLDSIVISISSCADIRIILLLWFFCCSGPKYSSLKLANNIDVDLV